MKIPPIRSTSPLQAYEKLRSASKAAPSATLRPDRVEISGEAASFGAAFRAVMQAVEGEESASRAQQIAKQVDSGEYQVSSQELAERILSGVRLDIEG